MLSIDNTYNFDEIREWDARVRRGLNPARPSATPSSSRSTASPSPSGTKRASSSSARPGGTASGATTSRSNLRTVRGDPPKLLAGDPLELLEIRGEVYMTNAELVRLNGLRAAAEETPFANPRNATAGSLKLLDPKLCAAGGSGSSPTAWGSPTGWRRVVLRDPGQAQGAGASRPARTTPCTSRSTRSSTTPSAGRLRRNTLDFQTDGLVVKVDDLAQRERLGTGARARAG